VGKRKGRVGRRERSVVRGGLGRRKGFSREGGSGKEVPGGGGGGGGGGGEGKEEEGILKRGGVGWIRERGGSGGTQ